MSVKDFTLFGKWTAIFVTLETSPGFQETLITRDRFCIDINSPRTLQTVTEKLFQAVSRYADDVT